MIVVYARENGADGCAPEICNTKTLTSFALPAHMAHKHLILCLRRIESIERAKVTILRSGLTQNIQ
ncbi:hypothetical protein PM082_000253 [Marasmius tenuissimus]|nr:hypothetical protein PM082_000253 [Marasmius tenuissimus]